MGQRLRAGIYNRCSTEEESQKNALAIQAAESQELVANKGWVLAAQYIESETGTVSYKRTEYQRLLEDMEKDIFDIVVIKSIDRLMRSAKDWYLFLEKLTANNLKLYIYIDNKFYTSEDNLISGIKAILAEEFSRELSKKIKNAHRRRQEKKSGLNITRPMFGWDKIEKDVYKINEDEAVYYREAFEMAKSGKGFYTIANVMYEKGVRNKEGKRISDVQWRKMLYTPRAHGTVVLHQRTYDFETKQFKKVPEEEWVYVEQAIPPIVSKEYQEEVLRCMEERAPDSKRGNYEKRNFVNTGKYELSHKLICGVCGASYYKASITSSLGTIAAWKCSTFLKNGRNSSGRKNGCNNINVYDDIMMDLIQEACEKQYQILFGNQENLINEALAIVRKALRSGTDEKEIDKLNRTFAKLQKRKNTLFQKLMDGIVSDQDFRQYNTELDGKIKQIEMQINSINKENEKYNNYEERLTKIKSSLYEGKLMNTAKTQELIKKIDRIVVYPDGRIEIVFDQLKLLGLFKVCGGELIESELDERFYKIEVRYVHVPLIERKREEDRKKILEVFKKNPELTIKDVAGLICRTEAYVNGRIKELKVKKLIRYEQGWHSGKWIVNDGST